MLLAEFTETTEDVVRDFLDFASTGLGLKNVPSIKIIRNKKFSIDNSSFGCFNLEDNSITVQTADRHVIDVLRTLAHELVHAKQKELNRLHDKSGETGSREENEANAVAGVIMRKYGKKRPDLFGGDYSINEAKDTKETSNLKTYIAKVKLQQQGYKQIVDVVTTATTQSMAIKNLAALYGKTNIVGTPKETGRAVK